MTLNLNMVDYLMGMQVQKYFNFIIYWDIKKPQLNKSKVVCCSSIKPVLSLDKFQMYVQLIKIK